MKRRTLLCFLLAVAAALISLPFAASGASAFEKSLSGFPESYRVLLREVHKQHPNWVFKPMQTGLSFYDAVSAESSGNRSLVPASNNYSYIFKSHESSDYNAASDYYYQKDGGFCKANKYAVSYFMDPRNHFTDAGIFQFEDLSFDDSFDVQAVDVVLAGTFMYNTKATYVTAAGATKTADETYAEMIYIAGKKYNINPCYLASKIRNEIGSTPSGSVTGRNSTYPGIYNFYNVGASDGAGAITRGLAWASNTSAGTYHRPWTTPKKSIVGGAEFLAATYIAKGQFTGYLQRFNVNPDCSYRVYEHQYMTSLSGAAEQSYSAYYTYLSNGLLDNAFIFSIPVYKGMTGADDNSGTLTLADAKSQHAAVALNTNINVRTGPSQNYDKLPLTLAPGAKVTILDVSFTDTTYYDSILRYPNWYKIRFKQDGVVYTGYVPSGFLKLTASVTVPRGDYTPKVSGSSALSYRFVSLDPDKVTVVGDTKLRFSKTGDAGVIAYDSTGRFALLRYKITADGSTDATTQKPSDAAPTTTKPPQQTTQPLLQPGEVTNPVQTGGGETSVTLAWNASQNATGYRVYQFDTQKRCFQPIQDSTAPTCVVQQLPAGSSAMFKIKAFNESNGRTGWSEASAAVTAYTTPAAVSSLKQTGSASTGVTLQWSAVAGATAYEVEQMDETTNQFRKVQTAGAKTCSISALQPSKAYRFRVRAIHTLQNTALQGKYSAVCTAATGPARVSGVTQSATTAAGYRLQWEPVAGAAGYKVFRIDPKSYDCILAGKTKKTAFAIENCEAGQIDVYTVKAYRKDGGTFYGDMSEEYLAASSPAKVQFLKQTGKTDNSATLQWNAVNNSSGYAIFRYDGSGWRKLKTVTDTVATIRDLPSGCTVKFRVRAYIRVNKQVLWGAWSNICNAATDN